MLIKVFNFQAVVAIGLSGACRREELCQLTVDDITDLNSALLVKINHTKNKIPRSFTVTESFYEICKKYMKLRPKNISEKRFFLNYKQGKCTKQVVGINKIGGMAKDIAGFLKLPNPEQFTGHCFRRSSATMLVNAGGDLLTLKRHGGWRSSAVAEGYIDDSIENKIQIANKIVKSVQSVHEDLRNKPEESQISSESSEPLCSTNTNVTITEKSVKKEEIPGINFQCCSNIIINYNFK